MSETDLLRDSRVAPYAIKYSNLTPLSFKSKPTPVVFSTSNQSTYTQQNNLVRIPISSATAFQDGTESFLKFTYENTSALPQQFCNSAHSIIEHMRILCKGVELENIQNYHQVHGCMSDLNLSSEVRQVRSVREGYGTNPLTFIDDMKEFDLSLNAVNMDNVNRELNKIYTAINLTTDDASLKCVNELLIAPTTDASGNNMVTVCLPLELSSVLGSSQKKLLPLWMLGEVTLELTLNKNCVFHPFDVAGATAPTFNVKNVEYHCSLIEFESSVNGALMAMASGSNGQPALGLHLHAVQFSTQMIAIAAGHNTLTVNERLRSIKSVFLAFSKSGKAYNVRSTGRVNNNITSLQFKFGSLYLPTYPMRGDADSDRDNSEYVVEALKAVGEYGSVAHSGLVNNKSFASNDNLMHKIGRSVFAINTDSFAKENVESGISTLENSPLNIVWSRNNAVAGQPLDCYVIMLHDSLININADGSVTRSI